MASHRSPALRSGERVGPYVVQGTLGTGGSASVYRARRASDHSLVALKVELSTPRRDQPARQRVAHEAAMLRATQGPHVPDVLEVDVSGGTPYLAMTLVGTMSLARHLRERGAPPLDEARRIIIGIASALQHIHDDGVLHMDLTPANVMLGGDHECIVDFGAAVKEDAAAAWAGTYDGTRGYTAPERCLGASPTRRMDVFSLGAVAYRTLIGIRPFADRRSLASPQHSFRNELAPPSLFRTDIGPAVDDLLLRALSIDPQERPESPLAFAREFDAALAGVPV